MFFNSKIIYVELIVQWTTILIIFFFRSAFCVASRCYRHRIHIVYSLKSKTHFEKFSYELNVNIILWQQKKSIHIFWGTEKEKESGCDKNTHIPNKMSFSFCHQSFVLFETKWKKQTSNNKNKLKLSMKCHIRSVE